MSGGDHFGHPFLQPDKKLYAKSSFISYNTSLLERGHIKSIKGLDNLSRQSYFCYVLKDENNCIIKRCIFFVI